MIAVLNVLPLPNPPFIKATVYTQVIESPLFLKLPLPNPPRCFGEGTSTARRKSKVKSQKSK